jgi:hypothetical protein
MFRFFEYSPLHLGHLHIKIIWGLNMFIRSLSLKKKAQQPTTPSVAFWPLYTELLPTQDTSIRAQIKRVERDRPTYAYGNSSPLEAQNNVSLKPLKEIIFF